MEENKQNIDSFFKDYWDNAADEAKNVNNRFTSEVPTAEVFLRDWRKSLLFPRQYKIVENSFSKDFQHISEQYNEYVLAYGKGTFTGDSELITACGKRKTLKELSEDNKSIKVWARNEKTGKINIIEGAYPFKKVNQENCYSFKTNCGHIQKVSADHKFFTINGWQKAKELKKGDWILGSQKYEIPVLYNEDSKLARLCGYLIGDGCMRGESKVIFFSGKPDITADYISLVKYFGAECKTHYHNGVANEYITMSYPNVEIRNRNIIIHHLKRLGLYDKLSFEKRIPVEFIFASKNVQRNLIEGLFATDGWACLNSKHVDIGYLSKNRKLIEDIDFILRGFGIVGRIASKYTTYKNEKREYFTYTITHQGHMKQFLQEFKLLGKKYTNLELLNHIKTIRHGFQTNIQLTSKIDLNNSLGFLKRKIKYYQKTKQGLSYDCLVEQNLLPTLANEDVIWERINEITDLGWQDVYTLSVPEHHNYMLGTIFSHNSGKDVTISELLNYIVFWLCHCKNPQAELGLKDGEPIDIVNIAFDAEQAESVFFEKFKRTIKETKDPTTGQNYYESIGMNLQKDILTNEIRFPKNIRAYSLNCLPYNQKVLTRQGYIRIGEIVHKKMQTEVLSFNEQTKQTEWKSITNWFEKEEKNINWYKIHFNFINSTKHAGKSIKCTHDHKLFIKDRGWIEAQHLRIGDIAYNAKPYPNEIQEQIILAGLIGDSTLTHNAIRFAHSTKQELYLKTKYQILNNLTATKIQKIVSKSKYGIFNGNSFSTIAVPEITKHYNKYKQNRYVQILNKLNDIGLAFWFGDDGYLSKQGFLSIALSKIDKLTEEFILSEMTNRGYNCKIHYYKKGQTILSFDKKSSYLFINNIKEYLPCSLTYKLNNQDCGKFWDNYKPHQNITPVEIIKIEKNYSQYKKDVNGRSKTCDSKNKKYCIEVADNHNFFAGGVLVENSVSFKAEGKNTIFAVFDEIGSFRFDKAEQIRKHIRTTARTRCMKFHKLFYISFLTSGNDYMAYLIDKAENEEIGKVYFDRAATWEVRNYNDAPEELKKYAVHKSDYQEDFDADPETSMLMYECKIPKFNSNAFIRQPQKVLDCISSLSSQREDYRHSPRINNEFSYTYDLMDEEFEPWFRPYYTEKIYNMEKEYENNPSDKLLEMIKFEKEKHSNAEYYVHIDLSRGVVDCAGIMLAHKYYILETPKLYVDFMCQVKADKEADEGAEIDMTKILDFVIKTLKNKYKFNIVKITADGWNSALFLNLCEKAGIEAEVISLERTLEPYETLKDYIYKADIDIYFYSTIIRELKELIITDKKKVDHPRKSQWRMKEEGVSSGSKDVTDCAAGIAFAASQNDDGDGLIFGSK